MTVSLGAAQELFLGVLKISLFFSAESNSINLGAFVNSIAYSQKLKIVVDFCTINLRSPSGMLMARKIWHAFFFTAKRAHSFPLLKSNLSPNKLNRTTQILGFHTYFPNRDFPCISPWPHGHRPHFFRSSFARWVTAAPSPVPRSARTPALWSRRGRRHRRRGET